ncbi:ATP-binding cassette domain-containing protein [Desulfomonile tiedjei]|uniref:ABC-type cobalt transport system, ATPase component n=1 Tax=Desulfomonile tiedjei (strain ATCC 49306 / DSM 6799 / DCB-1) TaxID=706587 RepID=I4C2L3_DESTA|nr:ATP-binding cassette domain-containing protein [Desulfomonile tiedjei]AFM23804.1 ABC-type cobalt transport system, ATPase component [Desulfomonile tiedjei DSM 6799]
MHISFDRVTHTYNKDTQLELTALSGISFELPSHRSLGILGGTGSGKTTLIKLLNGLLYPTSGRILIDGKDTRDYGSDLALRVGVVFQRPERQLFEDTVFNDISFVLRRFSGLPHSEIREIAWSAGRMMGLNLDRIGERHPESLSDSEKRKVAIAGILVNQPHILVLDEPGVGLDPAAVSDLVQLLGTMKTSGDRSVIIVSHDMGPFLPILDTLLVLNQGKLSAIGTPEEVCGELAEDPEMRNILPPIALLVHELRLAGFPIPFGEYRIPELAEEIARLAGDHRI